MKTLITCYMNPDLDGFSCAIAYSELLNKLGQNTAPFIAGDLQEEILFILKEFDLDYSNSSFNKEFPVILVDASEPNAISPNINIANVIEIIDHRKANDAELFTNAKVQIEFVGSAASLIAEKYKNAGFEPSRRAAILLSGAIISNTLNFQSGTTTQKDKDMIQYLAPYAKLPANFAHKMFVAKSDMSGDKLRKHLENEYSWRTEKNGERSGAGQLEIIGSEKLVTERKEEIFDIMSKIANKNNIAFQFLSIIDLEAGFNLFLCRDQRVKNLLKKTLGLEFNGNVAKRSGLIMRKEIMPLLRAELEKNS